MSTSGGPHRLKITRRYVIGSTIMFLAGIGQLWLGVHDHETLRSAMGVLGIIAGILGLIEVWDQHRKSAGEQ